MHNQWLLVVLAIVTLINLLAVVFHLRSQTSADERQGDARLLWERIDAGLHRPTSATRSWLREAFGAEFLLRNLVTVVLLVGFAALAFLLEYCFLQQTIAIILQEHSGALTILGPWRLSQLLSAFICTLSGIAGIFAFDEGHVFKNKLIAWNSLGVACLIEGYLGYIRASEFTLLGGLQAVLRHDELANPQPSPGFQVLNAVLGFLNPLLVALTTRYLITLVTWIMATGISVILFFALWLPAWMAQTRAARLKQREPKESKIFYRSREPSAFPGSEA